MQPQHLPYPLNPGLCCVVPTHPQTRPYYAVSVRQLIALPYASSRQNLTILPLLSVSTFSYVVKHKQDSRTGDLHPIRSRPCRAYTMAYTLTPSTAAILPGLSVNQLPLLLLSWSINLLGAGDAGRSAANVSSV